MNKKWYKSRSFYGAFVFALALWGYTSLNGTYNSNLKVPLEIELPKNRALKSDIPTSIVVQFRGTGWDLFNISFFGSSLNSKIDLSSRELNDNNLMITKTDMLNSLLNLGNLEARNINTDPFDIYYGKILDKKVPLVPNIDLSIKEGFKKTSNIILKPDSITLRGNEEILDTINYWQTEKMTILDAARSFEIEVNVNDDLNQIIKKSITTTNLSCKISQLSTIKLPDEKIKIKGGKIPSDFELSPTLAEFVIEAPIEYLADYHPKLLEVYVEYEDIIKAKSGLVPLRFEIDSNYSVRRFKPKFLYLSKSISSNSIP